MKKVLALLFCAVLVSACTTPGKKTAIGAGAGAALGAAAGAIIANNTGGKSVEGAIYGGLLGAGVGGLIGNYYDKQAKELAKIADVNRTENGIEVILKNDILFAVGSSELSAGAKQTLIELNTVLKKYPENIIQVQGNTDSTGSASFNQTLSEKRAKAVYDFILANGLKTSGLTYVGFGATNPIASNDTEEGKAKNRRVELKIKADEKLVKQNRQ